MASKIPFATDLTDYEKMPASPFGKVKPRREGIAQKRIEIRLVTVVYSAPQLSASECPALCEHSAQRAIWKDMVPALGILSPCQMIRKT